MHFSGKAMLNRLVKRLLPQALLPNRRRVPASLLVTLLAGVQLSGCGGGGGSDDSDFVGAATVRITARPSEIDTGDQTKISTEVGNVSPDGIALKFRFPSGLRYVPNSASLEVNDDSTEFSPTVNQSASRNDDNYVVFFLTQSAFQQSGQDYNGESGTFTFKLEGVSEVQNGLVEVDPDVDDPDIDNSTEFSVDSPEFSAEDEATIQVQD
jgi:hypothetical protein